MKKLVACLLMIGILVSMSACSSFFGFGTFYETAAQNYGQWGEDIEAPDFLPADVKDYTVNAYSYTLYSYMDTCYEIYLDITVEEDEFEPLLEQVRSYCDDYVEQKAPYCDGYMEIVFMDDYEPYEDGEQVGQAAIEKVIYNPITNNIVYVAFHAKDTGVYPVKDVAYFNRFSITAEGYSDC